MSEDTTITESYILPVPDGWAVVVYGDDLIPDDTIVPLPYGSAMSYDEVVESFSATPAGSRSMIDGWSTVDLLRALEPGLAQRVWV